MALTGCQPEGKEMHADHDHDGAKMAPQPAPDAARPAPRATSTVDAARITIDAPQQVTVGQKFSYTITVHNTTNTPMEKVHLTDTVPDNLRVDATEPKPASMEGNTGTWDLGTIAPKGHKTVTITATVQKEGRMTSCAQVRYELPRVCMNLEAVMPKLQIAREATPEVLICEEITLKYTVRNNGSGTAKNVVARETLPNGLTTLDGKKQIAYSVGDLGPGQARSFTVKTKASKRGTFAGTASATADGGWDAKSAESSTTVLDPVLAVNVTAPAQRFVGRPIPVEIAVSNKGNGPARNTRLVYHLPTGAKFLRAMDDGAYSAGKAVWNLGTLAPGDSKKVSLHMEGAAKGTLRGTAMATATCTKADDAAQTAVIGIPAILLECVDVEDPIELGNEETYVISVTNQGSADDTDIQLVCTLPEQQEFVSGDGPTKVTADGKTVTIGTLKSLAPKDKAVWRVKIRTTGTGDSRFKVSLTSKQFTKPIEEAESTNIYK